MLFISCQVQKSKSFHQEDSPQYPKLFLMSKGLVNDSLKAEFLKYIDEDPALLSVAVVVNATGSERKKIKKTAKVKKRFAEIGFDSSSVEMFDLLKRDNADLYTFDIIYILGGNPFRLLSEVKSTKADSTLIDLSQKGKILMGYSAGSLLCGPDLKLMNAVDSLLEFNEQGLDELSCLNLYEFYIFPHYEDFTNQVPELKDMIIDFENHSVLEVIRLNDNEAVVIENGERRVIGN
jgi:dipeptidase E